MVHSRTSLERGGLVRACRAGLDTVALRLRLREEIRRLIAFDAYCVNTADPATLLVTGSVGDGLPPEKTSLLFSLEYGHDDVHKLSALATGDTHVAVIDAASAQQSRRMREIFLPIGLGHELRAALTVDGTCWGYLHLLRRREAPAFDPDEMRLVASMAPHLAEALRVALLLDRGEHIDPSPEGPGVLTLDPDGGLEHANESARRWLAAMDGEVRAPLPHAIHVVAAQVDADGEPPRCMVRTRGGDWLVVHGSRLGDRIVIVLEKPSPLELSGFITRAYGFSPREQQVAMLLVRGSSNEAIADELEISIHTVKDHLKAVFEKTGVATRGELVSRIFLEHFAPRIRDGVPVGRNGGFRR